jgi:hypothetical protein
MGVVAIFGDLSGHPAPLYPALESLGVDVAAGSIPDGVTMVQVGDLVHRGPGGDEAVALVDRLMATSPGRWVQLLGNHEAEHVGGPAFGVCECSPATKATIRRWVRDGTVRLAVAVAPVDGEQLLVTHGGLTRWLWVRMGQPADAATAAATIVGSLYRNPGQALAAGMMLDGLAGDEPGVLWPAAGDELYASWAGHDVPFGQVHGHTSAWDWGAQGWRPGTPPEAVAAAAVDLRARHTTVVLGGRAFYGVDPGYGVGEPGTPIVPFILQGDVLDAPGGAPLPSDLVSKPIS